MNEKFTPGPWVRGAVAQVFTAPKRIEEVPFALDFFPICNANPCCRSKEENEANAALIAAAPDMYDILKHYFDLIQRADYGDILAEQKIFEDICYIEEVLMKARGEK